MMITKILVMPLDVVQSVLMVMTTFIKTLEMELLHVRDYVLMRQTVNYTQPAQEVIHVNTKKIAQRQLEKPANIHVTAYHQEVHANMIEVVQQIVVPALQQQDQRNLQRAHLVQKKGTIVTDNTHQPVLWLIPYMVITVRIPMYLLVLVLHAIALQRLHLALVRQQHHMATVMGIVGLLLPGQIIEIQTIPVDMRHRA
jgi:hypothetical protein